MDPQTIWEMLGSTWRRPCSIPFRWRLARSRSFLCREFFLRPSKGNERIVGGKEEASIPSYNWGWFNVQCMQFFWNWNRSGTAHKILRFSSEMLHFPLGLFLLPRMISSSNSRQIPTTNSSTHPSGTMNWTTEGRGEIGVGTSFDRQADRPAPSSVRSNENASSIASAVRDERY